MKVARIQWVERNEEKVALNGLSIDEVESVLLDPNANLTVSHGSGLPLMFGWTHTGRHIAVVLEVLDEREGYVYPTTAFETPEPKKRRRS